MSNLNNTVKKDDLDELTAMLQLLDEPEKLASEAVVGDEIDDLLADLNDETIVPVPAVAETVMEAKDGGDLTGVFEELENEHESLKVVDVEIPQVESISLFLRSTRHRVINLRLMKKGETRQRIVSCGSAKRVEGGEKRARSTQASIQLER